MTVSGVCVSPAAKSRVLVVGATGFIGRFVVEASLASGRPTYILVRLSSNPGSPCKTAKIAEALRDKGAIILYVVDRPLFLFSLNVLYMFVLGMILEFFVRTLIYGCKSRDQLMIGN